MIASNQMVKINTAAQNTCLVLLGMLWVLSIGIGFSKLYDFEYKSGTTDYVAQHWPSKSMIQPHQDLFQLVMVAHPKCPCTMASALELDSIMSKAQGKAEAYVFFIRLKGFAYDWVNTELYKAISRIPGVHAIIDDEGREAQLFGGTTSGQVFLYDPHGQLVFTGGITGARGQSGDNIGYDSIVALVNHQPVKVHSTPFFGCSLMNSMPGLFTQKGSSKR